MRFQRLKDAIKGQDTEKPSNMQKRFLEEQTKLEDVTGKTGVPEMVGAPDEKSNILINSNESMLKFIDDEKYEFDPIGLNKIFTGNLQNEYTNKINKYSDEIRMREMLQRLNMKSDLQNQK